MRRLSLAGFAVGALIVPAMAADMTPYDRIPLQAPPFYWTGAYIGADVGGAWPNIQNGLGIGSASGIIGGLYAGYNWQFAPTWLLGVGANAPLDRMHSTSTTGVSLGDGG